MLLSIVDTIIDLVVARNYVIKADRHDTAREQMNNSIYNAKQHGGSKAASELGYETTESSVEFMKSKGSFVNSVARLGKYWSQTIFFTEYVYGKPLKHKVFDCELLNKCK
jgi:hypothetical protein